MRPLDPPPSNKFYRFMLNRAYVSYIGRRIFTKYEGEFEGFKLVFRVKGSDRWLAREIFKWRPYEKYFTPKRESVVVDAGANVGYFAVRAARLVGPEGRVLAFEPFRESFRMIGRNAELNELKNITAINAGLGEEAGFAELRMYAQDSSNSLFDDTHDAKPLLGLQRVKIERLDDIPLVALDFLKLDAEGAELGILRGATKALERFSPKIVGEAHPFLSDKGEDILEFLKGFGYKGSLEPYLEDVQMFYAWKD